MAENQSIISHVSVGTNDFERAIAFYDAVLTTLGCQRIMEHPGTVAWAKSFPEFWVHIPIDGQQGVGRERRACQLRRRDQATGP